MAEVGKCMEKMAATVMLLQKAPRTQLEVAQLLGTTKASASRYFKALSSEGLIAPIRLDTTGKGRRAYFYEWVKP